MRATLEDIPKVVYRTAANRIAANETIPETPKVDAEDDPVELAEAAVLLRVPLADDAALLADALVDDAAELAELAAEEAEETCCTAPKTPPITLSGAELEPALAAALL